MNKINKIVQINKAPVLHRIAATLALMIILNNLAGFYFAFYLQQATIKKEVKSLLKSTLDESELVKLHFDPNSDEYRKLQWLDEHEFRYDGRMYDIIKSEKDEKNNLTFHCINDIKEEQLFSNLSEQIRRHIEQNPEKNTISKILIKALNLEFYQAASNDDIITSHKYDHQIICGQEDYLTDREIPSPPPRFS
jgi:hypothetical protein